MDQLANDAKEASFLRVFPNGAGVHHDDHIRRHGIVGKAAAHVPQRIPMSRWLSATFCWQP